MKISQLLIALLIMMFFGIILILPKHENKKIENNLTINQKTLIVFYEYGYVKGQLNEINCKSKKESELQWTKDSLECLKKYKSLME